jgi:hypothetical protein
VRTLSFLLLVLASARADFVVSTLDGKAPLRGISLIGDARQLGLHTADVPMVRVDTANVVEIVTLPQPAPPPLTARPFEVRLVDGSRLRGTLDAGPEDALKLNCAVLRETVGSLVLPLELVLEVRRVDDKRMKGASRVVREKGIDVAFTLDGAKTRGVVEAFTATAAVIERVGAGQGPRRIEYGKLAAILMDNPPMPRRNALELVARLADGSAVVLKNTFTIGRGMLTGETPSGLKLTIPAAQIAALGFTGGSFVHLSDLEADVQRTPYFPIPDGPAKESMLRFVCPVRMDRSPGGLPISVARRRYFKGIGVRPKTSLTFDIAGRYRFFETICGIDDEVFGPGYGRGAGSGSVIFSVFADGKRIYESPVVTGGKDPQRVRLDVRDVKKLTLVVDLVPKDRMPKGRPDSPELDNAVWARPLLIR